MTQKYLAYKVGIASFMMLLVIAGLLIWKSGLMLRASGYQLSGQFQNVAGLLNGAEVRYRGYPVGNVAQILPGPADIKVVFWIKSDIKVPKGSKLKIVFDGLIGEKYLSIVPSKDSTEFLESGAVMPGFSNPGLADFVDVGTQNLEETKKILESVSQVFTSDEVSDSLKQVIQNFGRISADVNAITEELRKVTRDQDLSGTMENIRVLSENLRKATDQLLADGKFVTELRESTSNFAKFSKNAGEMSQDLNDFIHKEKVYNKIDRTIENLEQFTEELRGLLKDSDMKSEMIKTLQETQGMMRKSGGLLETLAGIDISSDLDIRYYEKPKVTRYDLSVDFAANNQFFRVGAGNRQGGLKFYTVQQGIGLSDRLTTRFGLFYSEAGAALDYALTDDFTVTTEVYNTSNAIFDLVGYYRLMRYVDLSVGANDVFDTDNRTYTVGVNLHP